MAVQISDILAYQYTEDASPFIQVPKGSITTLSFEYTCDASPFIILEGIEEEIQNAIFFGCVC